MALGTAPVLELIFFWLEAQMAVVAAEKLLLGPGSCESSQEKKGSLLILCS